MSATAKGPAEVAPSSSPGVTGVGSVANSQNQSAASQPTADGALPVVGQRWREKYAIVEELKAKEDVKLWRGTCVDGGQPVLLRAFRPVEAEIRAQAWSKLGGIDSPHLQRARDAQRAGEWRVEVADIPAGTALNVWRAGRGSVDFETVKAIVAQMAEALSALHAFELVHLALRPECVFVVEHGTSLQCVIGGLDTLTSFDRKQPVPAAADPLYAPPETLGLSMHVPGPALCAWDWWSLGRVAQELILGRHVVALLEKIETRPSTPAVVAKAETLLQEADSKGPRAGAVEAMPSLDPQLQMLLRGLLTSSRDARWTGDNVDRWVRGQSVKEHYDTPRAETHFRWRGRPCTVPEMAGILQSADYWADNSVQLFEPTTPGTLAHFLRWSVSQATAHEQLTSALELADALPLKLSSKTAQREAVTMVALVFLSAGKLTWRGRPLESATIAEMMNELGEADALMVLRSLSTRSTALQIERIDSNGGRALTELGKTVGDVEGLLKRHGWLSPNDTAAYARLYRLALEPVPALRTMRESLAAKYAGSDHAAMEKLFKAQNVGRSELVALAWASSVPELCKFYTHAEAARRRAEALRARGAELTQALTWAQFEAALKLGPAVVAGWGWFILTWFLAAVVTLALWAGPRGAMLALAAIVGAVIFRIVLAPLIQSGLRKVVPQAKWSWRDGPARCRQELRLAGHGAVGAALHNELGEVRKELESLKDVKPAPAPLPELPRFGRVRLVAAGSWILVVAFLGVSGWRFVKHPPTAKELKAAWAPAKPKVVVPPPKAKSEQEKTAVKVSWPYRAGEEALKLNVTSTQPASSEQVSYAVRHGRELVEPYIPESVSTLIVMPVPAGEQIAVMLFDGKRGDLVNQQVYVLVFHPSGREWVEVGGRKGIYLDQ